MHISLFIADYMLTVFYVFVLLLSKRGSFSHAVVYPHPFTTSCSTGCCLLVCCRTNHFASYI